ncbi:hypothetical protein POM88_020492 [Heracleum sosnowskyi]|uniref:F-box domain-containing protein n=1 Tax=Heracleum sosnowskyi TaxID=360622 RepID=A0AAD8MRX7_9APIA|nr:hypothetical protein POM88_020492 [Heracleum sosnowskyi]
MEDLPDALVQYIVSYMNNAKDVACCNSVSKRWKDSMPYLKSLYFPRNIFDNLTAGKTPDCVIMQMVSSICRLEMLVVYCPFTSSPNWNNFCIGCSNGSKEVEHDCSMTIVVFDEADHMLAEGGFKQDSARIIKGIVKLRPNCQVLLFSEEKFSKPSTHSGYNNLQNGGNQEKIKREQNQLDCNKEVPPPAL